MSEPFVSTEIAAAHLAVSPRRLLDLVRGGHLPGYPLALGRRRHEWRFKLTELEKCLEDRKGSYADPVSRRNNRSL